MTGNERRRRLGADDEEDEDDGEVVAIVVQACRLDEEDEGAGEVVVGSYGVYPLDSRLVSQAPIDGKSWTAAS